jgi:hypothetical protein
MTKGPADWYLKAVRVNGRDVTDTGIDVRGVDIDGVEIVIGTTGAALTGRTEEENRRDDYAVVVYPVERVLWGAHSRYVKMAASSSDGSFTVTGLPPGEYWAVAIDVGQARARASDWRDPAFLERLSAHAARVVVAEGQRRSVVVPLAR